MGEALSFIPLTPKGDGGITITLGVGRRLQSSALVAPKIPRQLSFFPVTYRGLHAVSALSSLEAAVSRAWDEKGWKLVPGYEGN